MTVSTTTSSVGPYSCNGSTTEFPVTFPFLEDDDLVVYLIDSNGDSTTLTIDTHYTVTGAGGASGTVTTVATYASGNTILIDRVVDLLQETDLENQATYYPEVLEDALDKLTMIAQQLYSGVSRSIKFPTSDLPITDPVLPSRDERLGKFLQFDAVTGQPIATSQTIDVADYTGMAFETVADLRLSDPDTLAAGQLAVVGGYYAAGDGGGGPLRVWATSGAPYTDNGGSVIVPTTGDGSGAWVFEHSGMVNVKWFGAYGDNVNDDTSAIQAAIDSIVEGAVVLPAGDYMISDTIQILKNNIELYGLNTATLDVEDTAVLSDGVAIQSYSNTTNQPVNVRLENINVIVRTANGVGGIRWGAKYSSMRNVNVRIIGDNLTGVLLTCDDGGSGPYYDKLEQVFVQGDSNSVTPLTGTIGFDFVPSVATPSRGPNANTLTKCRVGGCYKAYRVRGHGHLFDGCVGEAINLYHFEFNHPSVASGSSYNTVIEYYAEHYNTATLCYCGTNSSGIMLINPYSTGIGTVFTDNSPNKNCRALLPADIPPHTTPYIRAAANVTGTTINAGFNAATVTTSGTGIFRLNFTNALSTANYYVSALPTGSDLGVRVSIFNTAYVQLLFFNTVTGAAADPTGFSVTVTR